MQDADAVDRIDAVSAGDVAEGLNRDGDRVRILHVKQLPCGTSPFALPFEVRM